MGNLVFDVQGGLLASGGDDGTVRVWDANLGGAPLAVRNLRESEGEIANKVEFTKRENNAGAVAGMWIHTNDSMCAIQV